MEPRDPRVLAVATAVVALLDALLPPAPAASGDELVPLASCGVERRALRRLVKQGRLEVVRLGRKLYTTRSSLAALVKAQRVDPPEPEAWAQSDPRAAARAAYAAPLRVLGGKS